MAAERIDAGIRIRLEGEEELQDELTDILSKIAKQSNVPIKVRAENIDEVQSELNRLLDTIQSGKTRSDLGQFISESDAAQLRKRIRRVTAEVDNLGEEGQKAMVKTSLASQEMIRIVQDAPFGLFGVTNNIQAMFDQLTNQARRTGESMTNIFKQSFKAMLTGPMAIGLLIAVVTGLALRWDELAGAMDRAKVVFGLMTKEQAALNKEMSKANDKIIDEFVEKLNDIQKLEMQQTLQELRTELTKHGERFTAWGRRTHFVRDGLSELQQEILTNITVTDANRRSFVNLLEAIENTTNATDEQKNAWKQAAREAFGLADGIEEINKKLDKARQQMFQRMEAEHENRTDVVTPLTFGEVLHRRLDENRIDFKQRIQKAADEGNDMLVDILKKSRERAAQTIREEASTELREFQRDRAELLFGFATTDFTDVGDAPEGDIDSALQEAEQFGREWYQRRMRAIRSGMATAQSQINEDAFKGEAGAAGILDPILFNEARLKIQEQRQTRFIDNEIKALREINQLAGTEENVRQQNVARIAELEAQKTAILAKGNRERAELQREELARSLDWGNQMVSSMGSTFGSLATVMGKASQDGFEQNKGWLVAQATANAIASSIGVASSILTNPAIPFPVNVGLAATAGASILAGLMAQVRQIKNMGKGGSGAQSITGKFTALNPTATAKRSANLEQHRRREGISRRERDRSNLRDEMARTREAIENQKVILERKVAEKAMNVSNKTKVKLQR